MLRQKLWLLRLLARDAENRLNQFDERDLLDDHLGNGDVTGRLRADFDGYEFPRIHRITAAPDFTIQR